MDSFSVGVLGCGDISDAYLSSDDRFDCFEIVGCANRSRGPAEAKAEEYDVTAYDVDELLADPTVDAVVNLTSPGAHAETTLRALEAGKHVYSEKPLATDTGEARSILETATERDLLVGCAPDTILGAGLQTCRAVVDEGRIGEPLGATVVWASSGHETWHPNPDFFYEEGGGPLYDVGPYYVAALVSLLGPARRATGSTSRATDERTIESEPRRGETIDVEVPTHETGTVEFADGVTANLLFSFDTPGGSSFPAPAFEIYGTEGTLALPDPNRFDGPVRVSDRDTDGFEAVSSTHGYTAGRGVGIADLARAVRTDWDHRTTGALAYHVLEIAEGIRTAADRGEHVAIESDPGRPAAVPTAFPDERVD
ncbi:MULTISPECIES: Gfo/Idh/MocA family protein [Halorussus]|uniref:Gfo/Idh/MocA family protein n=1 Tax=Halorussus TaxID=1070314 RepID=UPI0020A2140D|nr:Gfo/Idh/MocA family oxidoreductase [Halorussus vallis]USZ78387.1 Gfo/Idh/MocA family oxidoreductase [Halorussus vallis]